MADRQEDVFANLVLLCPVTFKCPYGVRMKAALSAPPTNKMTLSIEPKHLLLYSAFFVIHEAPQELDQLLQTFQQHFNNP